MRATVGISAEEGVIRAVLMSCPPEDGGPTAVLREVEDRAGDGAAAVPGVIDGIVAAAVPDVHIENVAVAYRTPEERRAMVTTLADGGWPSASLVSIRAALPAMAHTVPDQETFGTVVMLESVDHRTSCVVVGADRERVLASDTWQPGLVDADAAVTRIRRLCATVPIRPDGVILCGSGTDTGGVAAALEAGLGVPVLLAPDAATVAARGAARVAAAQIVETTAPTPVRNARFARPALIAVAIIAVLGAGGLATIRTGDDRPAAAAEERSSSAPVTTAPASPPAPATTAEPPIEPRPPGDRELADQLPPPPAPVTTAWTPAPVPSTRRRVPAPSTTSPEPVPETTVEPPSPAPATKVGAPGADGLFPGESPPPPSDADPAVIQQWWDNHWLNKQRWLSGG